jgi:ATP-binding cassette subfamily B multidrug efflux pump
MRVILRVFGYMRTYWLGEVAAYLCMLGISGVRLLSPQLIRRAIDVGIEQNDTSALINSVLLLILITLFQAVFNFGQGYLTEKVSQGVAYVMRGEIYRKLQSLSFSYHDRAETGQLLARATSDVDRLQRVTGRGILSIVEALVLLVSTAAILIRMQPTLALLSLAVMPLIIYMMTRYISVIHPLAHLRQDQTADLTSRLEQNLRGMEVVRGFAQEPAEITRFDGQNEKIYDTSIVMTRLNSLVMPLMILLASGSSVLILWYGGRLVTLNLLTLGELVAFNTYLLQLVNPVRRMSMTANMLGESTASADRVFEILDSESEVRNAPGAVEMGDIQGRVTFDHVSFAYFGGHSLAEGPSHAGSDGGDHDGHSHGSSQGSAVLDDLSFDVQPGQVVAVLGPTGSGKSTIINLIPRFYEVTRGAILIDGQDIRKVTVESLRRQIGIVLQETMLFGTTIRENIAFGRPEATHEEIETVARAARAHDFIVSFPQGYDTEVGERGVTLSGGQKQRIAIARALLLDPRILILDDATSSVDTETEQLIQAALTNLMRGRTSFVIAQRVSTVRNADLILVIDRGKLVASGRHSDLIRESGIYADIYYRQLSTGSSQLQPAAAGGK